MNYPAPTKIIETAIQNDLIVASTADNQKYFFRSLNYLGSKLRMLDTIGQVVNDLSPDGGVVADLFAGSGAVSRFLSKNRTVISADIQEYSRVICSALLSPSRNTNPTSFIVKCETSEFYIALREACAEIIEYETQSINLALEGSAYQLCEFLEEASLLKSRSESYKNCSSKLERVLTTSHDNILKLGCKSTGIATATLYFGGIYFSYEQTIAIDTILNEIENSNPSDKDTLLAALLGTVSSAVNTVGKQFAQPIQPRMANGIPKKGIALKAKKDRGINIFQSFSEMLQKYVQLESNGLSHSALRMDYADALDALPKNTSVVYADPPYTRDHYSRFYHVLETICLRDSPEISRTKVDGELQFSRGLYREERHQSPFCIRSQAPLAFNTLFKKVADIGASLVLSYSPHVVREGEHPRVMTIDDLTKLARNHFTTIYTVCPGEFKHNKLNSRANSFEEKPHGEILIVCKN